MSSGTAPIGSQIARVHEFALAGDVDALLGHLKLPDRDGGIAVRAVAARALGWMQAERATEPLISLLDDKDEDVRIAAMRALGRIKANQAVEPLARVTASPSAKLAGIAAETLGSIGGLRASAIVRGMLDHPDWLVRSSAAEAFAAIEGKTALRLSSGFPVVRSFGDD